jgi:heme-degrading monooxygenase HmoA
MHARVSTYAGASDELVAGFDRATGPVQEIDGFAGAYFLVDRDGNKAMSITLWDSDEALQASVERANQLREEAAGGAGVPVESVDHFEVAIKL